MTLNIPACFGLQGSFIMESNQINTAWKQISHLYKAGVV